MTAVGNRLAKLRAAVGESLRAAADRAGLSHSTVARIEGGMVQGSYANLQKLAEAYGVSVEWLMTGRELRPEFDAQLIAQALAADASQYVRAIRQAVDCGIGPADLAGYIDLIQRTRAAGMPRETLAVVVDAVTAQCRHVATARDSSRGRI